MNLEPQVEQGAAGRDIFFAAVGTTPMPMVVTDPHQPDNPVVFANDAFLQLTGYDRHEIVGRNCRLIQGPGTDRDAVREIGAAIRERRAVTVELLNYRRNGSSFWNALHLSPVHDAHGTLVYFVASQFDVSRRRDAEEALRQSRKMEAVGQLTGGIAHDFNNLLQIIIGYVDMLRGKTERYDDPVATRAVDAIAQAANRGATLTQQLLAFARKQRIEGRSIDLNALVEGLTPLIERTVGGSIAIERQLDPALMNIRLDTVQAELAILNLLINARDAMPDGGRITIETANRAITLEDFAALGELTPGRYVTLTISDSGSGMAPDVLKHVMEPFFTTKSAGKGTGLGLSMVYSFARQSGGTVRIYSEVGHGTCVRLFFPAVQDSAEPIEAVDPQVRAQQSGTETILLVEDQQAVADLAASILGDFGYRVLRAADGREALELLDGAEQIDLLFSDLIMPGGINGVVLAREAHKRQPRLKVLLTTGYAEASLENIDARASEFDVINKPYRRSELASKVRQLLDGPSGRAEA